MWKFLSRQRALTDQEKKQYLELALTERSVKVGAEIAKDLGLDELQEVYFQGSENKILLTPGQLVVTDPVLFEQARCHERTMNNEPEILLWGGYGLADVWEFIRNFRVITQQAWNGVVDTYLDLLWQRHRDLPDDLRQLFQNEAFIEAVSFADEEELPNFGNTGRYILEHPNILEELSGLAEIHGFIGDPCKR